MLGLEGKRAVTGVSVVNASEPCNCSCAFIPFDVTDWQAACCNKILPKLRVFCPRMQNRSEMDRHVFLPTHAFAVTPKMSTQAKSCSFDADSVFQWVCFESVGFAESIVLERQVQATKHFCHLLPQLAQQTCLKCSSDMPNA